MNSFDFFLDEEQRMIRDLARKIAEERVKPIREECDEKERFPWEIVRELAATDLFGIYIPVEYGGMGKGMFELSLIIEELSKVDAGIALCLAGTALGVIPIIHFGNESQKKKYLPEISKGSMVAAFAITEPEAGSDILTLQTTARKENGFYILDGTKHFISNAGEAQIYTVFATTDKAKGARGISAFLVEKGTAGFTFGKKERKLGIRSSPTRELIFNNCKIPRESLLGREGMGLMIALRTFDLSRPGVAAQALGIAEGALEEAIKYARERKQFGQSIISFQSISHRIAELASEIEAVRALLYNVCRLIDSNPRGKFTKESAMVKLLASDLAMKTTIEVIQILGGYGYMKDYPVEKMMRDAKITQIYEGTNEIQKNEIITAIIREFAKKK